MYGSGKLEVQIYGKATIGSPGRGQQAQARLSFLNRISGAPNGVITMQHSRRML
jgi:hypothetical protein